MPQSYGDSNGVAWWKELNGDEVFYVYRSPLRIRLDKITVHDCDLVGVKLNSLHLVYFKGGCMFGELILEPLREVEIMIDHAKDGKVFMSYTYYPNTAEEEISRLSIKCDKYSKALTEIREQFELLGWD